jgi:predicted HTH transcriptional regulator
MDKIQKSGVIPNFSYMHDVCMRLVSKSRQDTLNEVLEKIKLIDVSGGGSGRRLKEQVLTLITDMKSEKEEGK